MELSEVVNVQFAFPVVGVVLCAFLVFAFGFKSPGQPPSFDALDDDDRKNKRSRQRRPQHKSAADNVEGLHTQQPSSLNKSLPNVKQASTSSSPQPGSNVGSRSPATGQQQSPTSITIVTDGNIVNKNKLTKIQPKKPEEVTRAVAEVTAVDAVAVTKEERVIVGEWTTAVSRKDRKNRGRKDETPVGKHERTAAHNETPVKHLGTSNSPQPVSTKLSKKALSEMTTVTVIVPATTGQTSTTTTSTTVTQNAVIKVKVIPSVRVVPGSKNEKDTVLSSSTPPSSRKGKQGSTPSSSLAEVNLQNGITVSTPLQSPVGSVTVEAPSQDVDAVENEKSLEVEDANPKETEVEDSWLEVKSAKNAKKTSRGTAAVDSDEKYCKEIPSVADASAQTNSSEIPPRSAAFHPTRSTYSPNYTGSRPTPSHAHPNMPTAHSSAQNSASRSAVRGTNVVAPAAAANARRVRPATAPRAPWAQAAMTHSVVELKFGDDKPSDSETKSSAPAVITAAAIVARPPPPKPPTMAVSSSGKSASASPASGGKEIMKPQKLAAGSPVPNLSSTTAAVAAPETGKERNVSRPQSVTVKTPAPLSPAVNVNVAGSSTTNGAALAVIKTAAVSMSSAIATNKITSGDEVQQDVTAKITVVTTQNATESDSADDPEGVSPASQADERNPVDGEELPSDDETGDWLEAKPQKKRRKSRNQMC